MPANMKSMLRCYYTISIFGWLNIASKRLTSYKASPMGNVQHYGNIQPNCTIG